MQLWLKEATNNEKKENMGNYKFTNFQHYLGLEKNIIFVSFKKTKVTKTKVNHLIYLA